jgi:hypothetical protein
MRFYVFCLFLFVFDFSVRIYYLQLTHTVLYQMLNCQLGSHKATVNSGINVFISIPISCHPKPLHEVTLCAPYPPLHLHTGWQRKNPDCELSLRSLYSSCFLSGNAAAVLWSECLCLP